MNQVKAGQKRESLEGTEQVEIARGSGAGLPWLAKVVSDGPYAGMVWGAEDLGVLSRWPVLLAEPDPEADPVIKALRRAKPIPPGEIDAVRALLAEGKGDEGPWLPSEGFDLVLAEKGLREVIVPLLGGDTKAILVASRIRSAMSAAKAWIGEAYALGEARRKGQKNTAKVTIEREGDADGVGGGGIGGEDEDNCERRDYRWIRPLVEKLARTLGAEVETVKMESEDDDG